MGRTQPTYHDTEEMLLFDVPPVVFVDLDDLLNPCADRNEKPSGLGQLINQFLWYRRGGCSNVDTVIRATSSIACVGA